MAYGKKFQWNESKDAQLREIHARTEPEDTKALFCAALARAWRPRDGGPSVGSISNRLDNLGMKHKYRTS